jgi:hypothetical protein
VAELAELAVELRRSVSGFKLPEEMVEAPIGMQTMALAAGQSPEEAGPEAVAAEPSDQDAEVESVVEVQRQAGS